MEKVNRTEENNVVSIPVILSLFAGIMMIIGGLGVILMFGWYHQSMFGVGMGGLMMFDNMMHGGAGMWWSPVLIPNMYTFSLVSSIALSSILIGIGTVYVIGGYSMYKKPRSTRNWSIVILSTSIIGLVGIGGLGISTVLGIIAGGIGLASTRK
jgi:hypothetical protein